MEGISHKTPPTSLEFPLSELKHNLPTPLELGLIKEKEQTLLPKATAGWMRILSSVLTNQITTRRFQFAFMKHSSTTIALIKAVDSWKMAIGNTEKVVCAFLNLRKAFDTIDHNILLKKLSKHLHGKEYEWFRSYLSERSQ